MERDIILFDFNEVFKYQSFYRDEGHLWMHTGPMVGTNGYCDQKADRYFKSRINDIAKPSISFLGSGNYHYISLFLIERIKESFSLVLFDHHSDMQRTAWGGLVSCGDWVLQAAMRNKHLKQIILVGISKEAALALTAQASVEKELLVFLKEDIVTDVSWRQSLVGAVKYPVYFSVDKDVLCIDDAITDWDQGNMKIWQISAAITEISRIHRILGMDICGETAPFFGQPYDFQMASRKNSSANSLLLDTWKNASNQ
ncbi:MAG: hypothetical protein VB078_10295 [Clostridiaceae bacterium]|nr:hypothetical protein [Clostridiaceae bacterium]